jgi:hypothetical protein
VRLETKGETGNKAVRRKPCPTCPWRKDAEIGFFPPEAYRVSANTAYDGALSTFACHEQGTKAPATCAGFILANSANNIAVRLALSMDRLDLGRVGNPDEVELYESYRAMAIANGVAEDDPRIAGCRGDDEDGYEVMLRVRAAGAFEARNATDWLRHARDEDENDL